VDIFNRLIQCTLGTAPLVDPPTLPLIGLDQRSEFRVVAAELPQFRTQPLNRSLIGLGGLIGVVNQVSERGTHNRGPDRFIIRFEFEINSAVFTQFGVELIQAFYFANDQSLLCPILQRNNITRCRCVPRRRGHLGDWRYPRSLHDTPRSGTTLAGSGCIIDSSFAFQASRASRISSM
jgi:hypothetical protein